LSSWKISEDVNAKFSRPKHLLQGTFAIFVDDNATMRRALAATPKWRNLVSPLSEFNTVLNQVLALTDATTTECGLLPPDTIERHRCEGRLLALHQVIEFFLAIDRQKFLAEG
jgi:hypothetical protein